MVTKIRLDLFCTGIDLVPQPNYLDRLIGSGTALILAALRNEELDSKDQASAAEVAHDDLLPLRAWTRPHGAKPPKSGIAYADYVKLPHSILIDDFETILRPKDPGVTIVLAALHGNKEAFLGEWDAMPESERKRYVTIAIEAVAMGPDHWGFGPRLSWFKPLISWIDVEAVTKKLTTQAAIELEIWWTAVQMCSVISSQMNSSETIAARGRRGGRA